MDVVTGKSGDDFEAPDEAHAEEQLQVHQEPIMWRTTIILVFFQGIWIVHK